MFVLIWYWHISSTFISILNSFLIKLSILKQRIYIVQITFEKQNIIYCSNMYFAWILTLPFYLQQLENRRSSSLSTPVRKKPPELTVTRADEDLKPPQRSSSHSFLNVFFQRRRSSDTSKRSRSPSPIRNSADKRNKFSYEKTSSLSSQEDPADFLLSANPNDISDMSDVEKSYLKIDDSIQSKNFPRSFFFNVRVTFLN